MRAQSYRRAGSSGQPAYARATLAHAERHLRRRLLALDNGDEILVDLPQAVAFEDGDALVLEDGRSVEIAAANEDLYEVTAESGPSIAELAWHLGNRHLPAEVQPDRILIARDHVIHAMLTGLGASVRDIRAPFRPLRGAYHSHAHDH